MTAYEEMMIGSFVTLNVHYEASLGDLKKTFWPLTKGQIVAGHYDNDELEPEHKLWLIEIEDGAAHYQLWFRANKLGLDV